MAKSKGKKKMMPCTVCAVPYEADSLVTAQKQDGSSALFCRNCYTEHAFQCVSCGKRKVNASCGSWEAPEGKLCDYCLYTKYGQCSGCHSRFPSALLIIPSGSRHTFCGPCNANRIFRCAYCEEQYERADYLFRNTPQGDICRGCSERWKEIHEPPAIMRYSYKPEPIFQGKSRNRLFFGFELEIERKPKEGGYRTNNDDAARGLRTAMLDELGQPICYMKADGSIHDGFEIVSHPFSWSWFLANQAKFDPIFSMVKKGYLSHDSGRCGMHVHLSKNAFSPLHLYKFLHFFQEEQDFILKISQRGLNADSLKHYARIAYDSSDDCETLAYLAKHKHGHAVRYQAVNLQPTHTVEVRIFRGTLKKERFMKNMEFCEALYEFTMISSLSKVKLNHFIGFVHRYKNEFPNLFAFLEERYKFRILKRKKTKKGMAREAVRFEGAREYSGEVDVIDEAWDELRLKRAEAREKKINTRIATAKKTKEAAARR